MVIALVVFEFFITLPKEVALMWHRKINWSLVLFFVPRYSIMLKGILGVIRPAMLGPLVSPTFSQKSSPLNIYRGDIFKYSLEISCINHDVSPVVTPFRR